MAEPLLDQWGHPTSSTPYPWPDTTQNHIDPFHDVDWIDVDPPHDDDEQSAADILLTLAAILGIGALCVCLCICGCILAYNRSMRRRRQRRVVAQPQVNASQPTSTANQYPSAQGYSNSIPPASAPATNSPASQMPTYIHETKYVGGVAPPAVYMPHSEQLYQPPGDDQPPPPPYDQALAQPPSPSTGNQTILVPGPYGNVPAYHAQSPAPGTYPAQTANTPGAWPYPGQQPAYGAPQVDPMNPPLHPSLPRREQRKDSCIVS